MSASCSKRRRVDPQVNVDQITTTANSSQNDVNIVTASDILENETYLAIIIQFISFLNLFRFLFRINKFTKQFLNNNNNNEIFKRMFLNQFNTIIINNSKIIQFNNNNNQCILNDIKKLLITNDCNTTTQIFLSIPKNSNINYDIQC